MSVKFETESDRIIETRIMESLAKRFNIEYWKNDGEFTKIDYTIKFLNTNVEVYAELRTRYINHNSFGDVFISHRKWKECKELAKKEGKHFFWIFKFNDGIFMTNETDSTDEAPRFTKMGGLNIIREGSTNDREIMLHIPSTELTYVCKYIEPERDK